MRFTKLVFALLLSFCLAASAQQYGLTFHQLQVVDETGEKVTGISSVEIYRPDTTTNATIYQDPGKANAITIPMTTGSTNTTLSNGFFYWWGPDGWDFSITDGTNIATNSGHRTRTGSDGRIVFPSYLTSISSTTYADNETITLGTSADWVINAGTTIDLITFTPATNGAVFRVGTSNGATCADLQWYTASGVGLLIDEGADTLGITGLTTSINASSNYATNINTGTSTGAVTIGSSTAGAIALDSTSTLAANSDAAMSLTTTDASADITVDATAGSVIIDGGEAVADAVVIRATGAAAGIDITSLADIDITTTGAAGEDISITNTGGSIAISATENDAAAITITSNGGTSEKIVVTNTQGTNAAAIDLTATAGGITLTAGGGLTLAVTGTVTAGGSPITNKKAVVEVFNAADTLTAAESGKVCISIGLTGAGAGNLVLTLPTAAAGLEFYFYDANSVAADDLWVTAAAGDTINGGTAAKSYVCSGDAVKQGLHIVAQDADAWIILSEVGTWANDNN